MQWARTVAHENGFVAVIMRSDTETGSRGRSSFVLIGCERSGTYKCSLSHLVERMFRIKINMSGLRCRSLVLEMMFCSGLEQLPMKMDLL